MKSEQHPDFIAFGLTSRILFTNDNCDKKDNIVSYELTRLSSYARPDAEQKALVGSAEEEETYEIIGATTCFPSRGLTTDIFNWAAAPHFSHSV